MAEIEEDNINPETWTQKELLKHVYREIIALKQSVDSVSIATKEELKELEKRIDSLEKMATTLTSIYKFIGFIIVVASGVLTYVEFIK